MIQSREELQWVKLQGVGLPPHRGVGVWHLGCWDLKIDRKISLESLGCEWVFGDTKVQQKILEVAVGDTVDISEIRNHLEYFQNPLELAE